MPSRKLISEELADIFKVLAHPDRVRLIEELREAEHDVGSLAARMELPPARISQHLRTLKVSRLVTERREGRHHFYRLAHPDLARWVLQGLDFIEARFAAMPALQIEEVRALWTSSSDPATAEKKAEGSPDD